MTPVSYIQFPSLNNTVSQPESIVFGARFAIWAWETIRAYDRYRRTIRPRSPCCACIVRLPRNGAVDVTRSLRGARSRDFPLARSNRRLESRQDRAELAGRVGRNPSRAALERPGFRPQLAHGAQHHPKLSGIRRWLR